MNIWIVNHYAIPPSMGGLVRHYYFSKYLQKKGHNVKIFTSSKIHNTDINMIQDKSLYKEQMMDGVEYTFVRSRDYKGNGLDRIWNMIDLPFKMWKSMKVFYKQKKPDVIYTSSPDLFVAFFALLFGKKHKVPVVVEVRDLWPESIVTYNGISGRNSIIQILYQLEKLLYKKADSLIFTMPGGKEYLQDKKWNKKINMKKVFHINNGVDLEEYEKNKKECIIADKDLESKDIFKVVYVGSIRHVNHLSTLVECAREIKRRGISNILFLVYGEGTERAMLEKIVKEEKLPVKFKGQIEKKYIPYILSKASINVINVMGASINKYGCSWNKLFEYMASGKPIVSNLEISYDLIRKYNLGSSKNFKDSEEYAKEVLKYYYMDEEEYGDICENSLNLVKQYDYKKLTEMVERICLNAIK